MKANEGRLQTAEHILARIIENRLPDSAFIIARVAEDIGQIEISSKTDLRKIDKSLLQAEVNFVIEKNLPVRKYFIDRTEAATEFDLARLPQTVRQIRIVEIEGFDKTPCKDPHVENTSEIGYFEFLRLEKAGRDRFRFIFRVKQK